MNDDDLRHWDSDRVRENHDIFQEDLDREEQAERWLGYGLLVLALLGIWKILEFVWMAAGWALQIQ